MHDDTPAAPRVCLDSDNQSVLERLLADMSHLRADVAAEGRHTFVKWRPLVRRPAFAASALNLAHYQALRHRDLRSLQRALMRYGLSSLGRLEGRVLPTLDAAIAALAAILGRGSGPCFPTSRQFFRGENRLAENTTEMFGHATAGRPGRILVTLATDSAENPESIIELARLGMDAVRINCAHDDVTAWSQMIAHVRAAESAVGRRIKVLMDIAGPKCRTVAVSRPEDRKRLHPGDRVLLCRDLGNACTETQFRATCSLPEVIDRLTLGDRVYVDDGRFGGTVEGIGREGIVIRIDRAKVGGGKLKAEKGLNFPDTDLRLSPLTEKDLCDLTFVAAHADMVGYSFVEKPADIRLLQRELASRCRDWTRLGLVAKIETPHAVRNLPKIIVEAAGRQPFAVMIARGDLAVEIGFERLAEMQEEMLWLCEAAHIPAIWATEVLNNLIKTGVPSRGEMTDAAMSGRAECVMLNKGPNLCEGVAVLDRLLRRMSEHQSKKTPQLRALHSW